MGRRVHIELLNNCFYKFGFERAGLAIIFDDEYHILSVGMHTKNELKGIGLKYLNKKTIEEGNWEGHA